MPYLIYQSSLFRAAAVPEQAQMWKETFEEFSYEIRRLALKYPEDIVDRKLAAITGTTAEEPNVNADE